MSASFGVHAAAVVFDDKGDCGARRASLGVGRVFSRSCLHADFSAGPQRIAGIERQVEQNLAELRGVGEDAPGGGGEGDDELDVFADKAAQEILGGRDDQVERNGSRVRRLLAGEGEELLREGGALFASLADFFNVAAKRVGGIELGEQQIAVEQEAGEEIIEIVGDASGEAADDLHFLGLAELLLEPGAFGGVFDQDDEEGGIVLGVAG